MPLTSLVAAVLGTLAVLAWRIRESRRAVSTRSIVIPPMGMSTGFSMFMMPAFRVPWLWGLTAFVLAMAYRSWQLHGHDEVQDDLEDRRLARRAERGEFDSRDDDLGANLAVEAAEARDETEEPVISEQPSPFARGDRGDGS